MERVTKLYGVYGETAYLDMDGEVTFYNVPSPTEFRTIVKDYGSFENAMRKLEKEGWSLVPFDQIK